MGLSSILVRSTSGVFFRSTFFQISNFVNFPSWPKNYIKSRITYNFTLPLMLTLLNCFTFSGRPFLFFCDVVLLGQNVSTIDAALIESFCNVDFFLFLEKCSLIWIFCFYTGKVNSEVSEKLLNLGSCQVEELSVELGSSQFGSERVFQQTAYKAYKV